MRRNWIIAGLVTAVAAAGGAVAYQRGNHWKEFHFVGSRLKVDLAHPDALIRTSSLSRLPRDLLKAPIARDVLTEELAFYYDQQEDRLGLSGALKRIAYEHKLDWTDQILAGALNAPAELALWRDGKGALRHYALVMQRNALSRVLQQAATVALKDGQLKRAGEISTASGKAVVLALEINPRRTLLLISQGERLVVLSDPGLLFDTGNQPVAAARAAVQGWLTNEGVLARQFELDGVAASVGTKTAAPAPNHTIAVSAATLALGYGAFLSGFKGLRFDFTDSWSSSVWVDPQKLPPTGLGDARLWRAAPANPSACVLLPMDWQAVRKAVAEASKKPPLLDDATLKALNGPALACWYAESTLYTPVFIAQLAGRLPQRNASLQALADWAISSGGTSEQAAAGNSKTPDDVMVWRGADDGAMLGARGAYVAFSPDHALVEKVLDTLARTHPSVADQMPTSSATLALMTPRPLSAMAEQEMLSALGGPGDENLLAVTQARLPAHIKALAAYPAYRLEIRAQGQSQGNWRAVSWSNTPERAK